MMQKLNSLKNRKNKQVGFSLLEVMIAIVVSNIALLGLVAGELKSLQYSNNSYQYTISLIQANNAVERIFTDVCDLKADPAIFNDDYILNNLTPIAGYNLTFDARVNAGAGPFIEDFTVYVDWTDERMTDNSLNKVAVMASFPTVPAGCSVEDAV